MPLPIEQQPVTDVAWLEVPESQLAAVRFEGIRMADIGGAFDAGFAALGSAIERGDFVPLGPALAIYEGDLGEVLDLIIGFEVAQPPAPDLAVGELTITAGSIAAGQYAAVSHIGSFDGLGQAWGELMDEIAGGGAQVAGPIVEVYVSDPRTTPQPELRTDLFAPVVVTDAVA